MLAALLLPHLTAGAAIILFQGGYFGSSYRGKAQVKQISLRVAQFLPSIPVSHDTKPACKIPGSWSHSHILIFSFTLVLFLLWQVQICFVKNIQGIIWKDGHFSFILFLITHSSTHHQERTVPALTLICNIMPECLSSCSFKRVFINTLETYHLVIRGGCCDIDGLGLDIPWDFGCRGVAWLLLFSVLERNDPRVHQLSSLDR